MWWRLAVIAVLALPPAALVPQQTATPGETLDRAERVWQAKKPSSYQFTIQVICFCADLAKTPPSFRVTNNQPTLVGNFDVRDDRQVWTKQLYDRYNTIEQLFATTRRSMSAGQYKIAVQYDSQFGFPVTADLDPRLEIADDELSFRVTDFRVLSR